MWNIFSIILYIWLVCIIKISLLLATLSTIILRCKKPKRCPPINNKILLYTASELAQKIRSKELTCETVIKAYIKRVKEVNPILNAVVQDRFEAAIEEAKDTDTFLSKIDLSIEELELKYPLLGVPITVKGSIAVQNLSHRAGVYRRNVIASKDAEIVEKCKLAGAIVMLISNTPDYCTGYETRNQVTGTTRNPYDTRKTPGGSSGGEAALISSAASVIGIGSDVAGSLRLPPNFCGIWGHKPSAYTVPADGHFPALQDDSQIFTMGPIARYASDLPLLFNVIMKEERKYLIRLNEKIDIKDIKIFHVDPEGLIPSRKVDKEILDKMQEVMFYFKYKHSCDIKKLEMEKLPNLYSLTFAKILSEKGVEHVFSDGKEYVLIELIKCLFCQSKHHSMSIAYSLMHMFCSKFLSEKFVKSCASQIDEMRSNFINIMGNDSVLIYPSYTTAAHFHGESIFRFIDPGFYGVFNVLGFPVTNCPIGFTAGGMPFGIQVVATTNNDRLTLKVAEALEEVFGGWVPPPVSNSDDNYNNIDVSDKIIKQ